MRSLPELFRNNREWAKRQVERDPDFFGRLIQIQRPHYLWIGCADSRVPANEIVGLAPGDLFVQRNVANLVSPGDPNCMAVIEYAIDALGVQHIIVCGHYRCGGVRAALEGNTTGVVDAWLAPLREIARRERAALDTLPDLDAKWARLCELNVAAQVNTLVRTGVVQRAWARGGRLFVHGWIYDLSDGLLRDLGVTVGAADEVPPGKTASP